mgnify:CR=1 FL=1
MSKIRMPIFPFLLYTSIFLIILLFFSVQKIMQLPDCTTPSILLYIMAIAFDLSIPYVAASVIGGGLFGDQCSPISDTTVMSSTGASCNHVVHVMTQLPYGITVGVSAFIGFLFGGLSGQYVLSIGVTAVILLIALFALTKLSRIRHPEVIH